MAGELRPHSDEGLVKRESWSECQGRDGMGEGHLSLNGGKMVPKLASAMISRLELTECLNPSSVEFSSPEKARGIATLQELLQQAN
jgi:hypothetical protein